MPTRTLLLVVCSLLALLAGAHAASAGRQKLVVVVAKGSPVTSISLTDLKRSFLGDRVTVHDQVLVPFNTNPRTPERAGFDRSALGMSPDDVGRFWIDRKVRGQSGAPRDLPSVVYMAKVVAKFPGAIGYLAVDALTPDVQPVQVDGVAYTDPAYTISMESAAP